MLVRFAHHDDAKGYQSGFCFAPFKIFREIFVLLKSAVLADVGFVVVLELEGLGVSLEFPNEELQQSRVIEPADVIVEDRTEHRGVLQEIFKKVSLVKVWGVLIRLLQIFRAVLSSLLSLKCSDALPWRRKVKAAAQLDRLIEN